MTAAPRIATLDTIRGVAVMGILLMNIVAFAMPEAAYMNPAAWGSQHAIDYAAWAGNFLLVDGRMRGLFSVLFGASTLLVVERAEAAGRSGVVTHFSRMAWLFAFGMAHLYLIWWGDILQHYAVMGMIAFLFLRLEATQLAALAMPLILFEALWMGNATVHAFAVETAAHAAHPSAAALAAYRDLEANFGTPDPRILAHDVAVHRSGYAAIFANRLPEANWIPWQTFLNLGPETLAYMLLGMAGLKSGMLTGAWSHRTYRRIAVLGFAIGVPVYGAMTWYVFAQHFSASALMLTALMLATLIRPVMIAGWASLIVLLIRPGGALTTRIAAAGRMAFSNYLLTSLICTTLFYGYGFGLYGRLTRAELYLVVPAIWAAILLWSKLWLAHFRYGPLEWLWRSLSRWRLQQMRGAAA